MPYHHYIPRFILRGFIPEDTTSPGPAVQKTKKQRQREARKARKKGQPDPDTISVYDLQSKSIKPVPIAKEFGVWNFYQDATNLEDLEHLEKKLSELEGKAAQVIRNLHIAAGRQSSNQTFTLLRSDLQVLRKFIFLMHYRSSATEKTYFQEDHPRNAPIRQWIRHLKQSKGYTTDNAIWLDGLRYYLSTKHSEILEHAKQCSEYGPFRPIGESNVDIPSHQWHALAYESFTNNNYLGIWKSHEDSEFVLGHNSYGIWEGTLAGSPSLFRLYVISPKITIVLKLSMSKTLPSVFEDSTLSDHPLGFAQTVYSRGPHALGNRHASPKDQYDALQRHLQSPNSDNDQFTFRINGLTVDQTYLVNQVVLENLCADGLLVFASRDAMLPTARRYDTPEGPFLKKNREAIAGLVRCLESGPSGNPSTSAQPGAATGTLGSGDSNTSSSRPSMPSAPNFTRPPNPTFVRRPRVAVGLDDLMLPNEVVSHVMGRYRPGRPFAHSDWGEKDVGFDFLLYNILEGGVTFETEYDRAVMIHRHFPPLPSTVYPLVHFIAKRMTQARMLIEVVQALAEDRVEVTFPLGTPTKLVDSLGKKESKHLLEMLSLHVESLGLGWVLEQWDGECTESQKILEQVTIVAYLELLLEIDPNLAASLCSSVTFIEVVAQPAQLPSGAHIEEVEEIVPMRSNDPLQPELNISPPSSTPSSSPSSPFSSKSSRQAKLSLGNLLLPREPSGLFSEYDWAFDDMLLDVVEGSVVFPTEWERALYIHRLFPPLPSTLHPLVRLVGERMLEVQSMADVIRDRVQHRTVQRAGGGRGLKIDFHTRTHAELVDSLSSKDANRLFTTVSLLFESLGLGWAGDKWDRDHGVSSPILKEVTVVACLKVLLEDPNLVASLCSSVTFIETISPDSSPNNDDETKAGAAEDRSLTTRCGVPGERMMGFEGVQQGEVMLWTDFWIIPCMFLGAAAYLAAAVASLILLMFNRLLWDRRRREPVGPPSDTLQHGQAVLFTIPAPVGFLMFGCMSLYAGLYLMAAFLFGLPVVGMGSDRR